MKIGQTIKLCRKEKNLTQGQLAELIGVSTQAISKWETNAGMPDISQIVPLAKILEVSTDKLLGNTNEAYEKELQEVRSIYSGINLIDDMEKAADLYEKCLNFFNKYPDVPDVALRCLEYYVELFSKKKLDHSNELFLQECERYRNSIVRYETNSDHICKAYYLMARAYDLCGEAGKAEDVMKNLPYIYGDREYWEAEMAYADGKYDLAMEKIKKSFSMKARFVGRSIRLAVWITKAQNKEGTEQKCVALNEYMLRLIDAFLSGGDYLPRRQIFQKTKLLPYLVTEHMKLGNKEEAKKYLEELYKTREEYFRFLEHAEDKHCLMLVESEEEKTWETGHEDIEQCVEAAERAMKKFDKQ